MTIINIDYAVPADAIAKIEAHLAEVAMRDPDWNGAEFTIERDDYTCISGDDVDKLKGAQLLVGIQRIICGEESDV
ncbi:MAG: hypothetical protein ACRYG5_06690 [Janthinobacterium lividum]